MLYISGERDTLAQLQVLEEITGSPDDYRKALAELNPELFRRLSKGFKQLPPYTPIYLVSMPRFEPRHSAEVVRIVSGFSEGERKTLRTMQESELDIVNSVTVMDTLHDYQSYLYEGRNWLEAPIIQTPLYQLNQALKQKYLIKSSGETLKRKGEIAAGIYNERNELFQLMKKRDELNHEFLRIKGDKKAVASAKTKLELQTKELTAQIKKLLPKQIVGSAKKHTHGFTPMQAAILRSQSSSLKLARKGAAKIKVTHLDRMTQMGLKTYQSMSKGFTFLGNAVKGAATYTNFGLAAYNVSATIRQGGDALRTTFIEASSLYASDLLTAAGVGGLSTLGGIAIGAATGNAAIGSMILVCYPILGWVLLIGAGVVTAGAISYTVKGVTERLYDSFNNTYIEKWFLN